MLIYVEMSARTKSGFVPADRFTYMHAHTHPEWSSMYIGKMSNEYF